MRYIATCETHSRLVTSVSLAFSHSDHPRTRRQADQYRGRKVTHLCAQSGLPHV
jgi:hypothetical protein